MLYKYIFNYNPIISINLLYKEVTIHSRHFNKYWILFNLLAIVKSVEFLKYIFTKQFVAVFLLCQFRDIRNKVGSHFKKNEFVNCCNACCTVVLQTEQPSYRPLQSLVTLFSAVSISVKNALLKICLVLSSSLLLLCP